MSDDNLNYCQFSKAFRGNSDYHLNVIVVMWKKVRGKSQRNKILNHVNYKIVIINLSVERKFVDINTSQS